MKSDPTERGWRELILETRQGQRETLSRHNKIAPLYELWAHLTETKARRRLLQLALPQDGDRVLEVATGTGVQLSALARRNPSGLTIGLELAEGMVIETRNRLSTDHLVGVPILRADALRMPFADLSFDLVTNSYMLDLLPRELIPMALKEFGRVLRPGGQLVLANMTKGERPWHRGWDLLYRLGVPLTGNCRGVLAVPILQELGFEDTGREYIAQMSFPTEIVTAVKPL